MYNAKNYTEQGGERTVIGGILDVITGGLLKIAGVAITATAAEINAVVTGTVAVASHDYGGAAADWSLSDTEQRAGRIVVTNANGACAAIATPANGKHISIINTSGQAFTIKATGQTGVTIASTKSAIVAGNGTDFVRVTADA